MLLNPYRFSGGGGGGGTPPTLVGTILEGTPVGSGTTDSITRSFTAGNTALILIRWYNSASISSITCSGETITLVGSPQTRDSYARTQWAVINNVASTGSKTINVTYASAIQTSTLSAVELNGAKTSGAIGAHPAVATGVAVANPSHSITTTANASAIFAAIMCNVSTSTPGAGYITMGVVGSWSYEYGEYDLDAGSAGAKTVNWTMAAADWHIDAIEVLAA